MTQDSGHTAGPWQADFPQNFSETAKRGDCIIREMGGGRVAYVPVDPRCEANAHLIAAAPALLEALEQIAGMTDLDDPESYRSDDREGCLDAVQSVANTALLQARGEAG